MLLSLRFSSALLCLHDKMDPDSRQNDRINYKYLLHAIGKKPTEAEWKKIENHKQQLNCMLDIHYNSLSKLFPNLPRRYGERMGRQEDPIITAAHFTLDQRQKFNLVELANDERKLRIGHGHDILEQLRNAIGFKSLCIRESSQQRGYDRSLRSKQVIKRANSVVKKWTAAYRWNWDCLVKLGEDDLTFAGLQELLKTDTKSMSKWLIDKLYAQADEELPWIWVVSTLDPSKGTSDLVAQIQEWNDEGLQPLEISI